MKRLLLPSSTFVRAAKRFVRNHPQFEADLQLTLELLESDAFHPRLKTHKLKGQLSGSWACSAGYDLWIIFQFVKHRSKDTLLLEGIGTHDEVY